MAAPFYLAVLGVAGIGLWYWRKRIVEPLWIFSGGYLLVVMLYEVPVVRYLYPLLPAVAVLVAGGAKWIIAAQGSKASTLLAAGFALYAGCFGYGFTRMDRSPITEGIGDTRLQEVCRYISSNTPPDAVMVFRKPRLLALMTGHPTAVAANDDIEAYLRKIHAEYVVTADNIADEAITTQVGLRAAIEANRSMFPPLLSVGPYHLFRFIEPAKP